MMIAQIAFLVLFIGPILQIVDASNGYCPASVDGTPACQSNLNRIRTEISYVLAYDSEERKEIVQEAFAMIQNSVHKLIQPYEEYGIVDVWLGYSANLSLGTRRGNESTHAYELTRDMVTPDVRRSLEFLHGARHTYSPTMKCVMIVIEYVTNPCPNIADCQNVTNSLCHDKAVYVFYVSMGSSSAAGIEDVSNCICSHLAQNQTPNSQFCVPVTPVAGWSPTPGTIYKYTTPPPTIRTRPSVIVVRPTSSVRPADSVDQGSGSMLVILLSIGITLMVVSCIIAALAFNKFRLMKDHKGDDAVSPGKVSATSAAPEPDQVSTKMSGHGGMTDPTVQSSSEVPKKMSSRGSMKGPTPNVGGPIRAVVAKSQRKEASRPGNRKATSDPDATKSTSVTASLR